MNMKTVLIVLLALGTGVIFFMMATRNTPEEIPSTPTPAPGTMHPSWDADGDGVNDCEKDGTCDDSIDYTKPKPPTQPPTSTPGTMHPSWDADGDGVNDCEKDDTCDDSIDYTKPKPPSS